MLISLYRRSAQTGFLVERTAGANVVAVIAATPGRATGHYRVGQRRVHPILRTHQLHDLGRPVMAVARNVIRVCGP